jgi:hypothetical protein
MLQKLVEPLLLFYVDEHEIFIWGKLKRTKLYINFEYNLNASSPVRQLKATKRESYNGM